MSFRIRGLDPVLFAPLFDLDDAELARRSIIRMKVEEPHAAPCRISLQDAEVGEDLLLLNFDHQPAAGPYRASGPIFVSRGASEAYDLTDRVPAAILRRSISARAYDGRGLMTAGELVEGAEVSDLLEAWFRDPEVVQVHLHYARRGCFAAAATRA